MWRYVKTLDRRNFVDIQARRPIQNSKCRKFDLLWSCYIQLPVTLLTKRPIGFHNFVSFGNFETFDIASFWHQIWEDRMQIIQFKVYFIFITPLMTIPLDSKFSPLYPIFNRFSAFYIMTSKRIKMSLSKPAKYVLGVYDQADKYLCWRHPFKKIFQTLELPWLC